MWLEIGDRVQNRSGWTGNVVAVDSDNATVEWDNDQPPGRFGLDEDVDPGIDLIARRRPERSVR